MNLYYYFSTWAEFVPFFRQGFQGKGTYFQTSQTQPYLMEVPLDLHLQMNSENSYLEIYPIFASQIALEGDFPIRFSAEDFQFSEDLGTAQKGSDKILVQALNSWEIHCNWEKKSGQRYVLIFSGKCSEKSIVLNRLQKFLPGMIRRLLPAKFF